MNVGDRVRLTSAGIGVTLRSPYGTIVRPGTWDDWIIRLDAPCVFAHPGYTPAELAEMGEPCELAEIAESEDNMAELEHTVAADGEGETDGR